MRDPAIGIAGEFRALAPFRACVLADPFSRQPKHIHKRVVRAPVGGPGQIDAEAALGRHNREAGDRTEAETETKADQELFHNNYLVKGFVSDNNSSGCLRV